MLKNLSDQSLGKPHLGDIWVAPKIILNNEVEEVIGTILAQDQDLGTIIVL